MENPNYQREIDEAIQAGQRARSSLLQAKECLNSAGNWGLLDMFGGGLLTTYVKRSKMKDAEQLVQQAYSDLERFGRELSDVESVADFHVETGSFLAFADYFLDSFLIDLMVQSKIQNVKKQVDDAIEQVERILRQLEGL